MKYDIIVAGVGGQGVLSISAVITASGLRGGLFVKQSEEHGMSQRGGAVVSHVRLASQPIHSDLVGKGEADLVLSMEPVEALRYLPYLSPSGTVVSAVEPVINIPDYPDVEEILAAIRSLPGSRLIDAGTLARKAGSARAANMVIVGAAAGLLPIPPSMVEAHIREAFADKSAKIADINVRAFRAGLGDAGGSGPSGRAAQARDLR